MPSIIENPGPGTYLKVEIEKQMKGMNFNKYS